MNRSLPFLIVCIASLANAQEWTRFRGPNGSGVATGSVSIPTQWSEKDFYWKVAIPGGAHSSPVVYGERIFLTTADPSAGKRSLLCLKTSDGSTLWQKDFDFARFPKHNDNSYASGTPAVDADAVYVSWISPGNHELYAFDHEGKQLWKVSLGTHVSQHGNGASPIVFNDLVILANDNDGPDSCILAVDRKTGSQRWKLARNWNAKKAASATPCLYLVPDSIPQLITASTGDGLTGIDPRNGTIIWQTPDVCPFRVIASPVVAGDLVVINSGEGPRNRTLVAVRPGSATRKPQIVFKHSTADMPYVPSPVYHDGKLFVWTDVGNVFCMNPADGKTIWQQKVGGEFYGSPIVVDGRIYCMSKKGEAVVIAATDSYQPIARVPLNELCHTTPAVSGGKMYIRTVSHLISLGK